MDNSSTVVCDFSTVMDPFFERVDPREVDDAAFETGCLPLLAVELRAAQGVKRLTGPPGSEKKRAKEFVRTDGSTGEVRKWRGTLF